jgi:hypothetical protein
MPDVIAEVFFYSRDSELGTKSHALSEDVKSKRCVLSMIQLAPFFGKFLTADGVVNVSLGFYSVHAH